LPDTTLKASQKIRREVIAIIPARGGSKGLPRKNIIPLAGKPLIAYSILVAKKSELIDRVIVSTEDEEIAEVAVKWGAEVPFLRPKAMAGDNSLVYDAINYTMSKLKRENVDQVLVQLFPTSPFRTASFVDSLIELLFRGFSSVITVKKVNFDHQLLFIQDENNQLINIVSGQDTIPVWKKYYRSYATLTASWQQKPEKHYFHILTDKCMMIDIDTPKDLLWAERIIQNELFDFGLNLDNCNFTYSD